MIWFLLLLLQFQFQQVQSNENCSPGFYKSGKQCVACSPGKYQEQTGQTSCKKCDEGQYQNLYSKTACETCPTTGGNCSEHRLLCPLGNFNGRLSNNCTKCSPGFFSNDVGTTSCENCPRGFVQNSEGQSSCTSCPEKTESNTTDCRTCVKKWFRYSLTCVDLDTCPDKTFPNSSEIDICESCKRGTYLQNNNDSNCTVCPLGFVKKSDGPTDCKQCPQGHISTLQNCQKCPPHTIVDNNECKCLQGFYNESNVCVACSSITFQDEIGQESCKECPLKQVSGNTNVCAFCTSGSGYNDTSCDICPNGWARIDAGTGTGTGTGVDDGTCKECAVGTYSKNIRCVDCLIGLYQNEQAQTECKYCLNGQYQNEQAQTDCRYCNGSDQPNIIGKGSTFCCDKNVCDTLKCGAGRDRASSNCTMCAPGYWSSLESNCQTCQNGYIAPNEESHECSMCQDGQESNSEHTVCVHCPAGKYEEGFECKSCARGKFTTSSGRTLCESCPLLGTQPQTTNETEQRSNSTCAPCSGNLIIDLTGKCVECGQGQFVESYECKTCPLGYYSNSNHESSCTVCPSGWTTNGPGTSSCISCLGNDCGCAPGKSGPPCKDCPTGWWSTGGVTCNACNERTYQDQKGQNGCKNCAAGKYSDVRGSGECKICPAGYFQTKNTQGSCFDCPLGRYSLSGYDKECTTCPNGTSTVNENSVRKGECQNCTAGKYESNGMCNECGERFYQDQEGQTTCKSCPGEKWSEPGSNKTDDCFEIGSLTTYTFGNMKDQTLSSAFETTCEIRPNFVLLCPTCTCNSDSRNGFWDGPLCNECRRGFASRYCTSICPGYNGHDDSTMCNGNGRCWFGRFGNGLCYCGGNHVIDQTAENSFVDVRTCPRGQICPGYGSSAIEKTSYIPQYYIIQYRQFTTFVLQMSKYTPERGHMWFKRYAPSKAYENSCSVCTAKYDSSLMTEVGYWAKNDTYQIFPPQGQTANGFHGENCQHECAVCLNNGYCVHSPHLFYYSYTIKDTFMDKARVIVPTTACICRASVFDASHMCCPNGFQPYIYYGSKHTDPYSRFDAIPFITSIDNIQTYSYYRDRDLWLYSNNNKPQYPPVYSEPESGTFKVAERSEINVRNYHESGPYNKHVYHGTTRDICRACPGLFGKGVRVQETLVQTEQEAEDYWWDFSASSGDKKCANQGVCDFYAQEREVDVDFMGNYATWSLLHRGVLCRSDPTFAFRQADDLEECVKFANGEGALFVGFGPKFYKGGNDAQFTETHQRTDEDVTYAYAQKDSLVEGDIQPKWYTLTGELPIPDSDSEYKIYPYFGSSNCIGYTKCDVFQNETKYQYNIYDVTRGRGDDRFFRTSKGATSQEINEEASYDRFDTCFTFTKNENPTQLGLYATIDYKQGLDPFIGGLCPRGYFCTQTNLTAREHDTIPPVGYKEACPPGYYQPQYGMTRTDNNVRCNRGVHNTIDEACQLNTATFEDNDYVDNVCLRCPRHMWAAEGSYECNECPKGTVKKISGHFDLEQIKVFNMDTIQNDDWYYIPDEIGNEIDDCAKVPPAVVHIPGLDTKMKEIAQNQQFLPLITCPYGFSNRPGTYIIQDKWDISNINPTIDFSLPPYVKNNGIESAIVSDVPCDCLLEDNKNGIKYLTPPTPEICWKYARISGTLPEIRPDPDSGLNSLNGGNNAKNIDIENVFWDGCSKIRMSTTVHYHYTINQQPTFVKNIPSSLQFICIKKVTNIELTKQITAQYCFTCPGDSVTGPETGVCSTCPGNMVKKNMKLAIQKLVERSYPRLYQCYSSDSTLIENNIIGQARDSAYVGGGTKPPHDELMKCKTIVKQHKDTSIDVEYEEDNIQAWQFLIDENTIWKVDSVFWPILYTNDTKVTKLTLSDCILACSTTWGSTLNINRKVRVGIALKESDRNFCLCNNGGSTEAYYRYVDSRQDDVLHQAKYKKNYIVTPTRCDDITNIDDCGHAASIISQFAHRPTKFYRGYPAHRGLGNQTEFPHGCYQHNGRMYWNTGGVDMCTAGKAEGCVCVNKTVSTNNSDYNFLQQKSSEKILWYQSQVEEQWNKIRPLCGSCTPGKKFFNSKCENCAAGQYTATSEETMQATCQNCPIGFYQSDRGKSYCSMCMVGLAIDNLQATKCKECEAGYYENEMGKGQHTGQTGVQTHIKCKECPSGFFQQLLKQTACKECPKGQYQNEVIQTDCKDCQEGQYADQNKQKMCKGCPIGYRQHETAKPSCEPCSKGRFSLIESDNRTECNKCPNNNLYQNEKGQSTCKSCGPTNSHDRPPPDGKLVNGNYHGYADEEGSEKCKACKGGYKCPKSYNMQFTETKCEDGSVNGVQPDTIFGIECTNCVGRETSNEEGTMCRLCPAPKQIPNDLYFLLGSVAPITTLTNLKVGYQYRVGVGCRECEHGEHALGPWRASNPYGDDYPRPVCTACTGTQKIDGTTGCVDCQTGEVMDPDNDRQCKRCDGNTIVKDGTCQDCPPDHQPNTDNTACDYCGGVLWNESFTGFSTEPIYEQLGSVPGGRQCFLDAVSNHESVACKNSGPGPEIICYATWKITFKEGTDIACFAAGKVSTEVGLYLRPIGTLVDFPSYFEQSGCGCNGGCVCMSDYKYLLNYDKDWKVGRHHSTMQGDDGLHWTRGDYFYGSVMGDLKCFDHSNPYLTTGYTTHSNWNIISSEYENWKGFDSEQLLVMWWVLDDETSNNAKNLDLRHTRPYQYQNWGLPAFGEQFRVNNTCRSK